LRTHFHRAVEGGERLIAQDLAMFLPRDVVGR
jgi:hypothetical protein